MIEYEQRYKVTDVEGMLARLKEHGVMVREEQHVIDKWQMPTSVHSQADHDRFFDDEHGVAYRIRYTETSDGKSSLVLDSKQHTEASNHNSFREEILPFDNERDMVKYLEEQGYYNWLTIDKLRRRFDSPHANLDIVMDTVAGVKDELGLDTVLEIEYAGDTSRDEALKTINDFAAEIGLTDSDLFDKSLTVEAMRVLARFK